MFTQKTLKIYLRIMKITHEKKKIKIKKKYQCNAMQCCVNNNPSAESKQGTLRTRELRCPPLFCCLGGHRIVNFRHSELLPV